MDLQNTKFSLINPVIIYKNIAKILVFRTDISNYMPNFLLVSCPKTKLCSPSNIILEKIPNFASYFAPYPS